MTLALCQIVAKSANCWRTALPELLLFSSRMLKSTLEEGEKRSYELGVDLTLLLLPRYPASVSQVNSARTCRP